MGTIKKRLLIIGGNNVLDEIVSFAKEQNIVLVSAGNNRKSNIHSISEEQYYIDVTDETIMKRFIIDKKIDGVFSCSSEDVIPHSIDYLSALNMHCIFTKTQWNTLMNKRSLMDTCAAYGIDIIPEYHIDSQTDINDCSIHYPVLVKPSDCGGSMGITVCNDINQLENAIQIAYTYSSSHQILIEQYIDAPYFQIEVYISHGQAYLGYTKERIFYNAQPGCVKQPFVDIYPSHEHERIKQQFFPKFAKLLLDLGIQNGTVQLQGLITDTHIYPMDVAYRLSGGMDFRVVAKEKGISIVKHHLEYALTGIWDTHFEKCDEPYKQLYATICPGLSNGVIANISGVDQVKALKYVYSYFQYYQEGEEMTKSGTFCQTFCRIFIVGQTISDLKSKTIEIMKLIDVKDENGNSMILSCNLEQ